MMKTFLFVILVIFALLIGLYPLIYFFVDHNHTFLHTKLPEIIHHTVWRFFFFAHIIFGGISLFIGWRQFGATFRTKYKALHKIIGRTYIFSVVISSLSGIYIGFFTNGGIISSLGFISLGVIWFTTTAIGFFKIKNGNVLQHQKLMTYSYACTFAAVTLRLWMPLLKFIILTPGVSYLIVAWLCWIPNLLVAYYLNKIHSLQNQQRQ